MYNQGWEGYFGNVSSVIGRRGGLQTQTRELIKSIEIASNVTALTVHHHPGLPRQPQAVDLIQGRLQSIEAAHCWILSNIHKLLFLMHLLDDFLIVTSIWLLHPDFSFL